MHKRYEMRRSFSVPLDVITACWDEPVELKGLDLSPAGAFIKSELIPDKGEQIVCSFKLKPAGREYCFFGEVSRVCLSRRKAEQGKAGFGVKFLDTTPLERLAIRDALRGLPPPMPVPVRKQLEYVSLDAL